MKLGGTKLNYDADLEALHLVLIQTIHVVAHLHKNLPMRSHRIRLQSL